MAFYFMFPLSQEDTASVFEQAYDLAKKLGQDDIEFLDLDDATRYLLDNDWCPRNKQAYDKMKERDSQ